MLRRPDTARCCGWGLALLTLCACGTTRAGLRWGETATLTPSGATLARAAREAALDPLTWVPLAGAALLSIDDLDEGLSDWAREHTPVFGSQEKAQDASDRLRGIAQGTWYASMLLTPSGDEPGEWLLYKAEGALVEGTAVFVAHQLTFGLKHLVERERPDGTDLESFPSGYATSAASFTTLTGRNVDTLDLPEGARWALHGGLIALSAGTSWARVEGGKHYPTDVLFGAGLANFVVSFIHDAFLGSAAEPRVTASADPQGHAWSVSLSWSR